MSYTRKEFKMPNEGLPSEELRITHEKIPSDTPEESLSEIKKRGGNVIRAFNASEATTATPAEFTTKEETIKESAMDNPAFKDAINTSSDDSSSKTDGEALETDYDTSEANNDTPETDNGISETSNENPINPEDYYPTQGSAAELPQDQKVETQESTSSNVTEETPDDSNFTPAPEESLEETTTEEIEGTTNPQEITQESSEEEAVQDSPEEATQASPEEAAAQELAKKAAVEALKKLGTEYPNGL